jgi:ATP-dependent RNA helicase DDX31/DBP7
MGGENPKKEKAKLRKGLTVVIATPGRLLYHLQNTASINFSRL